VARVPLPFTPAPELAEPFVIVKPARTAHSVSDPANVTTDPSADPSMMVEATMAGFRGSVECRRILFPPNSMFSLYVPGCTVMSQLSRGFTESMASWIMVKSSGTLIGAYSVKCAMMCFPVSINTSAGFADPDKSPVQWSNLYPQPETAYTVTVMSSSYHPVAGVERSSSKTLPVSVVATSAWSQKYSGVVVKYHTGPGVSPPSFLETTCQ